MKKMQKNLEEEASNPNSSAWSEHGQQRAYVSSQMLGQAPIEEVQLLLISEKYIKF